MIIGQTIQSGAATQEYLTPWFPRGADNAVFTFQRIHSTLNDDEVVEVYHKNAEDSGTGSGAAAFAQLGSTDLFEAGCTGLKEMVRFRVQLKDSGGWLHFRFLPPTWYSTGKT